MERNEMSLEPNVHPGWLVTLSAPNLSQAGPFYLLQHLHAPSHWSVKAQRVSYTRPTVSGAFTQEDAAPGFGVMRDVSVSANHSPVTWMDFFLSGD